MFFEVKFKTKSLYFKCSLAGRNSPLWWKSFVDDRKNSKWTMT